MICILLGPSKFIIPPTSTHVKTRAGTMCWFTKPRTTASVAWDPRVRTPLSILLTLLHPVLYPPLPVNLTPPPSPPLIVSPSQNRTRSKLKTDPNRFSGMFDPHRFVTVRSRGMPLFPSSSWINLSVTSHSSTFLISFLPPYNAKSVPNPPQT